MSLDGPLRGGYVPTLLDYARIIEWMEDHPTGDSLPEEFRPAFTDALNRAHLGRIAALMSDESRS